jgi:hypothetical protein
MGCSPELTLDEPVRLRKRAELCQFSLSLSRSFDTGKLLKLIEEINALLEKRRGKNEFPESPRLRQNALADEA